MPRTSTASSATMILCMLVGALAAEQPDVDAIEGPNLIANGDFEAVGEGLSCPFPGWAGRSGQGGQYAFTSGPGRSGKAALIVGTAAGRGDIHVAEGFAVAAGEMLRLRFWTRTDGLAGGAYAVLEGEPNDNGWHKVNIDPSADWKQHEAVVEVPKGAQGQAVPMLNLWIYHFGTGTLAIDDVSVCVVKADPVAAARHELERVRAWLAAAPDARHKATAKPLIARVDKALADAAAADIPPLRRDALAAISAWHGGDGSFAVGVGTALDKLFLEPPFGGAFAPALGIVAARGEAEGAQAVVVSAGGALAGMALELDGDLIGPKGARLGASQVRIDLVGYVDTAQGDRPYRASRIGWWPDPLLPNAVFAVEPDEAQPLWITVTTSASTEPGAYRGTLLVKRAGTVAATLPLQVEVVAVTAPERPEFRSFALGASPAVVATYYGGDPGETIMERFAVAAAERQLPPIDLINGWAWKTAKAPKRADGGYDFAALDRWIDVLRGPGLTAFPMAVAPRFRKFGGGEYDDAFKRELAAFITAYAAHLKQKGIYDAALFYNIDEASEGLGEWETCKELHRLVKHAAPDLPVVQCLNEFKGVQALTGHADIWDLYFGQYDQAGGPQRRAAGDGIYLSVCIWPSEHPNLFIDYPALDARIMPWICHRLGVAGTEYWDLFVGWDDNVGNRDWWRTGDGSRTAWRMAKATGDGLLMYPGPDGQPISSIRLEAFRDGIEDHAWLVQLAKRAPGDARAAALLKEAGESLVTGVTSYDPDPAKLLDLRKRILACLAKR